MSDTAPPPAIHFRAETTDGTQLVLPDADRGKPLVLVVGLTRGASDALDRWGAALETRCGSRATIVGVAVLDRVPGFVRGMVKRAIDKDVGPPQPGKPGFVTTFDGRSLRANAPDGKPDDPLVVVFRADGSVATVERRPFTDDAAARVAAAVP